MHRCNQYSCDHLAMFNITLCWWNTEFPRMQTIFGGDFGDGECLSKQNYVPVSVKQRRRKLVKEHLWLATYVHAIVCKVFKFHHHAIFWTAFKFHQHAIVCTVFKFHHHANVCTVLNLSSTIMPRCTVFKFHQHTIVCTMLKFHQQISSPASTDGLILLSYSMDHERFHWQTLLRNLKILICRKLAFWKKVSLNG